MKNIITFQIDEKDKKLISKACEITGLNNSSLIRSIVLKECRLLLLSNQINPETL